MTFARQSSGLVKAWSPWDAMAYQWMGASYIFGTTMFTQMAQMLGQFPGTNPYIGILLSGIGVVPMLVVAAMLSSAMPRCGGDYIWISRIISPVVGYSIVLGGTIPLVLWLFALWNGYNLSVLFLSGGLGLIGTLTNSPSLLATSVWFSGNQAIAICTVLSIIVPAVWISFGMRRYAWIQRAILVISMAGFIAIIGAFFATPQSTYISSFNGLFSNIGPDAYHQVITTASVSTAFSWSDTMVWTAYTASVFIWLWMAAPMLGEIKNADSLKHMMVANLSGLVLSVITQLLVVVAMYYSLGWDFTVSIGKLIFLNDNSTVAKMSFVPYFVYLPFVAVQSIALIVLVLIGLSLTAFFYNTVNLLTPSRYLFAMSFDRVLPERIAYVSPTFGTPLVSIAVSATACIVWYIFSTTYPAVWLFVSATALVAFVAMMLICISGIAFPYRKSTKHIYEVSPGAKYKVVGIPVISILGAIGVIWMLIITYYYAAVPALLGPVYPPTYYAIPAVLIGAAVLYYIFRWYRKRDGIDIGLAFRDLPPL